MSLAGVPATRTGLRDVGVVSVGRLDAFHVDVTGTLSSGLQVADVLSGQFEFVCGLRVLRHCVVQSSAVRGYVPP